MPKLPRDPQWWEPEDGDDCCRDCEWADYCTCLDVDLTGDSVIEEADGP